MYPPRLSGTISIKLILAGVMSVILPSACPMWLPAVTRCTSPSLVCTRPNMCPPRRRGQRSQTRSLSELKHSGVPPARRSCGSSRRLRAVGDVALLRPARRDLVLVEIAVGLGRELERQLVVGVLAVRLDVDVVQSDD